MGTSANRGRQGNNRAERRERRKDRRQTPSRGVISNYQEKTGPRFIELEAMNPRQAAFIDSMNRNPLTAATGCAGTGKTWVGLRRGAQLLLSGQVERLICTKPNFEIDEKLGTLPGDEQEKQAVLMRSMHYVLEKALGKSHLENLIRSEKVIYAPLGSILGLTYDDAFMFMDESQNATQGQVKAFLTRMGKRTRVVLAGDYKEQTFIEGRNGLRDAVERFTGKPGFGQVNFRVSDIVRDDFVKTIIKAYRIGTDLESEED